LGLLKNFGARQNEPRFSVPPRKLGLKAGQLFSAKLNSFLEKINMGCEFFMAFFLAGKWRAIAGSPTLSNRETGNRRMADNLFTQNYGIAWKLWGTKRRVAK
jgi:hypothetical protein